MAIVQHRVAHVDAAQRTVELFLERGDGAVSEELYVLGLATLAMAEWSVQQLRSRA